MGIPELIDDLNIISGLGDNPNTDNGLTAEELKAKFDIGALRIQEYLNNVVVPFVNSLPVTAGLPVYESEEYPGCYYQLREGSDTKFWINPPMVPGKVYNTVERFNGNTVKVIAYEFTLSSSEKNEFALYTPGGDNDLISPATIISLTGVIGINADAETAGHYAHVPFYTASDLYCSLDYLMNKLYVSHSSSVAGYNLMAVLKYV